MKRNKAVMFITLVIVAVFYALTCGFAATSVKAPQTAFSTVKVEMSDGSSVVSSNTSSVTLDIDKGTNKVYAYIGEIRTSHKDSGGQEYVNVILDFKRRSSSDSSYSKRVGNTQDDRIFVTHGSGGYRWTLIYDGGKTELDYNRVKIHCSDEIDIYEVAFVNKNGKVLNAEYISGSELEGEAGHRNICDEPSSFTCSVSKSHIFTDRELEEIAAVKTVMRNDGKTLGEGALNAELNALSVAAFGLNTFALRLPSLLAGFAILVAVYLLADLLFGNDFISVISVAVCLAFGSVFSVSFLAYGSVSACFAIYAFYFAIKFFAADYYVEDAGNAALDISLAGLFFGLSAATKASLFVLLPGLAAIIIYAYVRAAKRYKAEEKAAKGLDKETVYLAYGRKRNFYRLVSLVSLIVIPLAVVLISYAFVGKALKGMYGAGFMGSAFSFIGSAFGFGSGIIPVKLLIGMGSENLGGGYYAFANYITAGLSIISLLFVIVLLIAKSKNKKVSAAAGASANKIKLILTAFVSAFIAGVFGAAEYVTDFALCSAFYALVVALAVCLAESLFGKKANVVATVLVGVSLAAFFVGYVGYTGINVSETARNILYGWQI